MIKKKDLYLHHVEGFWDSTIMYYLEKIFLFFIIDKFLNKIQPGGRRLDREGNYLNSRFPFK